MEHASDLAGVIGGAFAMGDGDTHWLRRVGFGVEASLRTGRGFLGMRFDLRAPPYVRSWDEPLGACPFESLAAEALSSHAPEDFAVHEPAPPDVACAREVLRTSEQKAVFHGLAPRVGMRDFIAMTLRESSHAGLVLLFPADRELSLPARARHRWLEAAQHLSLALQSRKRWRDGAQNPTDGLCTLTSTTARAARAGRRHPAPTWDELAMGVWIPLGTWARGRLSFVFLARAPERLRRVRALSARERDVAALAAEARANKEIAARLGVAMPTVATQLSHALERLGLSRRAELVALVRSLRDTSRVYELDDGVVAVVCVLAAPSPRARLTAAEAAVAESLLRGATVREVARLRGTAVATTAKQAASVRRKLGGVTRYELLARARDEIAI